MIDKLKESREEFVKKVIDSLEKGELLWQKDWETTGPVRNADSNKNYNGVNVIRLLSASMQKGYADPRWCTFNQAKKNEWNVKKGEKGTQIEIFKFYDKSTKKDLDMRMFNSLSHEEKNKYFEENVYVMAKIYTVFNAEQIEGIPKLICCGQVFL